LDKVHSPRLFSPIARRYDFINSVLSFGLDHWWRRRLVQLAAPRPGERLLDLCTGTGAIVLAFARREPQLIITGVDLSAEMLAVGRAKLETLRRPAQITLQEGDALATGFRDGRFDLVTIAFGLRNLPDYQQALREMRRVLRPGGRLLILEFGLPSAPLFRAIYRPYMRHWVPWLGGRLSGAGAEAYRYLDRSIRDFPPPARLALLMKEEGFSPIKTLSLSGGIARLYRGERGS
jgi:demethylmenaquinone methyltransferase/2-methoxy-6-polyprenyl-1,4-benzoquinol methylase